MTNDLLKLMIPGPVQPDSQVLAAMGAPVRPHYGAAFTRYYMETLDLLRKVFETRGDVFVMPGSGTVAIDACIGSAFSTGEKILVGVNGFFGERLISVAESYGLNVVRVDASWGEPLRAEDFQAAFRRHADAKGAAVVHLETSTAVINPVAEIGAEVRKAGGVFFVDAVSSLGGLPVRMDEACIDLCASASQKCLGAPPGLAPVAIGARAWEVIDREPNKAHGWYGNLRIWRQYFVDWGDWHPFPVTMATSNLVALRTGLDQLLAEGIPQRLERYRQLALRLRASLRRIDMQPFTPDERLAPVLTAAYGPNGINTEEIVKYLEEAHHIKISGGLGDLHGKIFRIGHMSPTVSEADIDEVVLALEEFERVKTIRVS